MGPFLQFLRLCLLPHAGGGRGALSVPLARPLQQSLHVSPSFCRPQVIAAAAGVMEQTIDHIDRRYGSAFNYLRHIGISEARAALCGSALPLQLRFPRTACLTAAWALRLSANAGRVRRHCAKPHDAGAGGARNRRDSRMPRQPG